jgi:succinate dehydrogenase/fumarate reductase flavoprotein subunit
VTGAVGFNLVDGRFYTFKAKATVLATAGCFYRTAGMFQAAGDGIAAAYRAGAQMRNAEFCGMGDIADKATGITCLWKPFKHLMR